MTRSIDPILPGSTIGVLGSGQLGRMFALAARRMGYRIHAYSPETDTPAGQVADAEIVDSYDDLDAVREFARGVSVVTFEFENIPFATAKAAEECAPVRPGGEVLYTTQHRLREKTFLSRNGFPVTPFLAVRNMDELRKGVAELGYPSVLKTAGFGYDGKGQRKLNSPADIETEIKTADGTEMILEAFVDFEREVSVVAARSADGIFRHWGVIENSHHHHILEISICPADVPPFVAEQAVEITRAILEKLNVIGVLCVEYFLTRSGKLVVNELAPRPHNSAHLTVDAHVTSQFEQQLRAVCGLALGSTQQLRSAAMLNLLGDLWSEGEPNWPAALRYGDVKLHLYGKKIPEPGRKMGHITALGSTTREAATLARSAFDALRRKQP